MYNEKKEMCAYVYMKTTSYDLLPLPLPLPLLRFVTDDLRRRLLRLSNKTPVVGYVFGGGVGSGDGFRLEF